MKSKTKKIIIVALAVAAIAVILWITLRGSKKTANGIINRLKTSWSIKKAIKSHLDQAKVEQDINANAAENNMTYEQALALTAAYYLVNDGTVSDATWNEWADQVRAM